MEKPSQKGSNVILDISIFLRTDGQIGISHNDPNGKGFITTVNDKKGFARCHRNLYNHLKGILQKHGKWEG